MQTIKLNTGGTSVKVAVGGRSLQTGNLFKNLIFWMPLTSEWTQSSTTVSDRGPKHLHTAVSGNPVIGAESTAFDGSDYIVVADSGTDYFNFTNTSKWSLAISFKTSTATCGLVGRRSTQGWICQISSGKLDFFIDDTGGNRNTAGTKTVNDGAWHTAVFTFDGSANPMRVVFCDGVADTITSGAATVTAYDNTGLNMYIGSRPGPATYITGSIRDVMIWNRTLTLADAKQYHAYMQSLNLS